MPALNSTAPCSSGQDNLKRHLAFPLPCDTKRPGRRDNLPVKSRFPRKTRAAQRQDRSGRPGGVRGRQPGLATAAKSENTLKFKGLQKSLTVPI